MIFSQNISPSETLECSPSLLRHGVSLLPVPWIDCIPLSSYLCTAYVICLKLLPTRTALTYQFSITHFKRLLLASVAKASLLTGFHKFLYFLYINTFFCIFLSYICYLPPEVLTTCGCGCGYLYLALCCNTSPLIYGSFSNRNLKMDFPTWHSVLNKEVSEPEICFKK